MIQQAPPTECKICNATGRETFRFMSEKFIFDVDLAREIVQDGREAVELDEDDIRFSLAKCHLHKEHIPHVDVKYPGIIAHVWFPQNGEQVRGHRLIDGHHRAARCLELGVPYFAYLLSEEESQAILERGPE